MIARRYRITGRVQGVGFRAFVLRLAAAHGVAGWVRNDPDGGVTVVGAVASGAEAELERFRSGLEAGPAAARVEGVAESSAEPPTKPGFHVA